MSGTAVGAAAMTGLYLHIPFCLRKCRYCDFNSRAASPGVIQDYLAALRAELSALASALDGPLGTIYLGGGTPTILTEAQLEALLEVVFRRFRVDAAAELTIEANPGTLEPSKARRLRSLGVNRVSLGIQSLRDHHLRKLGRAHTAAQALESLETLRNAGFRNIGADLIYAIPGQTLDEWEGDLRRVLGFGPEHLSLYALTIEPGTSFHRSLMRGSLVPAPEELELEMYQLADILVASTGYEHYEISNYARPGFRSRHNSIYWTGGDYLGAGAGAHSFMSRPRPVRWSNVRDPTAYIRRWREGKSPVARREELTEETRLAEALMLGLRMMEGVAQEDFRRQHGVAPLERFGERLSSGFSRGWLEVSGDRLRLTAEGVIFSNEVFASLF